MLINPLPPAPLCCSPLPSGHWVGTRQRGVSACLQVIGVVEADVDGGDHPGLEERLEDLVGHRVCDEVEVEGVFPAKGKRSGTQHNDGRKSTWSPSLPPLPGEKQQQMKKNWPSWENKSPSGPLSSGTRGRERP